jgi:hypothetical protein
MAAEPIDRHSEAVEEFNRHEGRTDGARVAGSLEAALCVLRDLLYARIHFDVEKIVGTDSMTMPLSEAKSQRMTKVEIEMYQIVESACAVREFRYSKSDDGWYLTWLARLRLGDAALTETPSRRIAGYQAMNSDKRRLALVDVLLKVMPESRGAPLVLFRLLPLAVHLATAQAFGDTVSASGARKRQVALLPAIADCHRCRGAVLENGEICDGCGNPMWRYEWLTITD